MTFIEERVIGAVRDFLARRAGAAPQDCLSRRSAGPANQPAAAPDHAADAEQARAAQWLTLRLGGKAAHGVAHGRLSSPSCVLLRPRFGMAFSYPESATATRARARPPGRARPSAEPSSARPPRGPPRAGRARRAAPQRLGPDGRVEGAAVRAGDAPQRLRSDPHRRGQDGDVAGEGLEHGEAEALALGGHEDRVGGVDPQWNLRGIDATECQQRHVAGDHLGAVVALLGSRGIGREQQVAPVLIEAELTPRGRALDRPEPSDIDPARQHLEAAAHQAARQERRQRIGHRRHQPLERDRRQRHGARARVDEVGPVERHRVCAGPHRHRRPCGQPEVGVDDVEACAPVAAA